MDKETPLLLKIGTGMYKFAWNLLGLTQIPPQRTKQGSPRRTKYHEANTVPRNVVSVHNHYPKATRTWAPIAQDKNNMTPSSTSLKSDFGSVQMAQALLDHGANVNIGNNWGEISSYQELEGEYHIQ